MNRFFLSSFSQSHTQDYCSHVHSASDPKYRYCSAIFPSPSSAAESALHNITLLSRAIALTNKYGDRYK